MEKKPPFQHLRHMKLVTGGCYELRRPLTGVRQFVLLSVHVSRDVSDWYDITALTPDGKTVEFGFEDNVSLRRLS